MSGSLPQSTRQFHFMREIASGGFGSVYLTKIIHADGFTRLAATKLLHPKWSENEEIAKRMRDEARLLGWLRHRNIVDVLDLTMIDGRCAVIMEYLEAVDLKVVIKSAKLREEPIPMRVSLEVISAVASALDAAYNRPPYAGEKPLRVIHRDIKPSNVMVDDSGTPKVLDFGVARADFDERESHTQELSFGSVDYMPPERLFFEPETAASDIYSLGATLYELLTLERLGKGKLSRDAQDANVTERLRKIDELFPKVDAAAREELADLLFEMLAFEPTERPTAASTVDRLRALSRKLREEPALSEWAERNIPPLVQAFHQRRPRDATDPLLEKTLSEDSRPFGRWATEEVEDEPREDPPAPAPPAEDLGEAVKLPEDDKRWKKLKEATLAEISEEVSGRVPRGSDPIPTPQAGLGFSAAFDLDEVDDAPTMAFSDMAAFTEWEEDEQPTVAMRLEDLRGGLADDEEWEHEDAAVLEEESTARKPSPPEKKPATPSLPPTLPASLRGRSAQVYTPSDPPPKSKSAPPPPPSVGRSATPAPAAPVSARRRGGDPLTTGRTTIDPEALREAAATDDFEAVPKQGRSFMGTLVTLAVAAIVVFVFGIAGVVAGAAGLRSMRAAPEAPPTEAPVAAAAPAAPIEDATDSPLAAGEASFESGLSNPKKLVVVCGSKRATGVSRARLEVGDGADCVVTAISQDRKRKMTSLAATAVAYTCFGDGGANCIDPSAPLVPADTEPVEPGEEGAPEAP
jgi:serine/threonine protein kinase